MKFTKNEEETNFKWDNVGNLLQDYKANYTYNDFNQTTKVETLVEIYKSTDMMQKAYAMKWKKMDNLFNLFSIYVK